MNDIHPTAIVGADVSIGHNNVIGAYTVITGDVTLGDDNWIAPHVVIGSPGEHRQHRASTACAGRISIGSRNYIYEFTAIQGPTQGLTHIGSDCFVMDKVHIAHDCIVEDGVSIAPSGVLGGHVTLGKDANLGMGSIIHQHRSVGQLAMLGMGALVTSDIPPFSLAYGVPARYRGLNALGIARSEHSSVDQAELLRIMRDPSRAHDSRLPGPIIDAITQWASKGNQLPNEAN